MLKCVKGFWVEWGLEDLVCALNCLVAGLAEWLRFQGLRASGHGISELGANNIERPYIGAKDLG